MDRDIITPSHQVVNIISLALGLIESNIQDNHTELKLPLNQASICSDDSASDLSTSSVEQDVRVSSPLSPQRLIFESYWEKVGGLSAKKTRCLSRTSYSKTTGKFVDDVSATTTLERSLKLFNEKERVAAQRHVPSKSSSQPRRSIFSHASKSHQDLSLNDLSLKRTPVRKTISSSGFEGRLKQSCLKVGRYSSPICGYCSKVSLPKTWNVKPEMCLQHVDSFSLSVSFSADVNVIVYERPVEHWAADGWTNVFAH